MPKTDGEWLPVLYRLAQPLPQVFRDPDEALPACAGSWRLFDATTHLAHRHARLLCAECPLLDACERIEPSRYQDGTLAGRLYSNGRLIDVRAHCAECGAEFEPTHHLQRYCSDACRTAAWRPKRKAS